MARIFKSLTCWAAVAAVSLAAGCASLLATSVVPDGPFVAKGEISSKLGTASWDEYRVAGPKIDVTRRSDGSWAGRIGGMVVDVSVYPDRIVGSGLLLTLVKEKEKISVFGQVHNRIVRFEVDNENFMIRTPTRSLDLPRTGRNEFREISFIGEADQQDPPEPQFALALVGAFF